MRQVQQVTDGVYWIGGNDFKTACFENYIPIPHGITYNSYFIDDEKTAVVDTVDAAIAEQFMENVEAMLGDRPLDYIIINHMEPDHSATLFALAEKYPTAKLCGSAPALRMFEQFFHCPMKDRYILTNEKVTISLGKRTLRFFMAPMVHWPEVTFTYDETDQILFSADAFGTFGVLEGSIFADELDYKNRYEDEARRYYTCIVSKYGMQVQNAMKKIATVPISILAPLHGPVFRRAEEMSVIMNDLATWAKWEADTKGVAIFYASIYGNTGKAAQILAWQLQEKGVRHVKILDLCKTDTSYGLAEAMRTTHLVFAAPTYNMGLYPKMRTFLEMLEDHAIHDRKVGLIGNSSWAPNMAGKLMKDMVSKWKNCEFVGEPVHVASAPGPKEEESLDALATLLAEDLKSN